MEGISRWLTESAGSTLWEAFADKNSCFSTLRGTSVDNGQSFLNARTGLRCQRTADSRSSGAPGRFRAARPEVMSRRDSLPPSSEMTSVQVKGPYSVSGADGRGRYSGGGKSLRPPAAADRCSRAAGTSVLMEGISRFLWESAGSTLWEAFADKNSRFSTLWGTSVDSGQSFPNARTGLRCQRTADSRSSGAPGRFRAARPEVMSRRDSLPPSSEMTSVQVKGPYSVSGADGRERDMVFLSLPAPKCTVP